METDIYKTIAGKSEGIFKDKGSRFIALAFPLTTEEEIKETLSIIRKQYHDATHHCYAYRLGYDNLTWRANDDGEPSGSAGRPIFGQIQSNDLTNILIVVIRYYGGTKLGVSGLINAYRTAASDAIKNVQIIEKTIDITVDINFEYSAMNQVMKVIKDENIHQVSHKFDLHCNVRLIIRKNKIEKIIELFNKIENTEITMI